MTRPERDRIWTRDLDEPVWSSLPDSLPPALRPAADETPTGDLFRTYALLVADVLDEPGPEIVSLHCHDPFSPAAVAVHSVDGRLLDLVWHDGRLDAISAFPEGGPIVCAGVNSEVGLRTALQGTPLPDHHPPTVFAFRAREGRLNGIFAVDDELATERPEWAYRLGPVEATQNLKTSRSSLLMSEQGEEPLLRLTLDRRGTTNRSSVHFYIREDGSWIHGYASDTYKNAEGVIPLEELRLVPLGSDDPTSSP